MFIIKLLKEIREKVNLSEDVQVIENILFLIYINNGISNKEIAKFLLLPIPVVSAIKNEFKKIDIVKQDCGIKLTKKGFEYVTKTLQYENFDLDLYNKLQGNIDDFENLLAPELSIIKKLLDERPIVDVELDQSKCTPSTSLKRAVLALQKNSLIGKNILCFGDDDLISISIALLTMRLFNSKENNKSNITVVDIDDRILNYINSINTDISLNITTIKYDARQLPPSSLVNTFDCLFTDPPYTIEGLKLFLSRGLYMLKNEGNLNVFFSFANKQPKVTLEMQKSFNDLGLVITEIHKHFNFYEGAKIIGGFSQMICLTTTPNYSLIIDDVYGDDLYTGEIRKTIRTYKCKNCKELFTIGFSEKIKTIEKLKTTRCFSCNANVFDLISKK